MKKKLLSALAGLALVAVVVPGAAPGRAARIGVWAEAAAPSVPQPSSASTTLGDGDVLVAGGASGAGAMPTVQRYDVATGTWSAAPPMLSARRDHSLTTLADGRVLAAGGGGLTGPETEIFDPVAATWTAGPPLVGDHRIHRAVLLGDGRVLLGGGTTDAAAEIVDVDTGTTVVAPLPSGPRWAYSLVALPDGGALAVGGAVGSASVTDVDRLSPAGIWTAAAPLPETVVWPALAVLPDGRVLAAGGAIHPTEESALSRDAFTYDPATDRWMLTASMLVGRADPEVAVLSSGRVLVAEETSAELFDGTTWSHAGSPQSPFSLDALAALPGDRALGVSTAGADVAQAAIYDATVIPSPEPVVTVTAGRVYGPGGHTVVATVRDRVSGEPVLGQMLFAVESGPSEGVEGWCENGCATYAAGTARFGYVGVAPGVDVVRATLDVDADGIADADEPTATATVQWLARQASIETFAVTSPGSVAGAPLRARLWGTAGRYSSPVRGQRLDFWVGDDLLCSGVTAQDGIAGCGGAADRVAAATGFRVTYDATLWLTAAEGTGRTV